MAKRGQGEGTISKRLVNGVWDGTWWARITVGKDENGKQKRKAFYGKTRKEVQEKLTAALNDVNNNTYIEPSQMTLEQWMHIWFNEYKKGFVKPKTYSRYYFEIFRYVVPILGKCKLKDLRTDSIQKLMNSLSTSGLASSSIAHTSSVLTSALEQAVDNELIAKNIAAKVKLPKVEKKEMRVLSPEEQARFIETARDKNNGEIFILALATGLRIGEILALTWEDINFDEGVLSVNKTVGYIQEHGSTDKRYHFVVGTPKTKSSNRIVPLLPSIATILQDFRERQNQYKAKVGDYFEDHNIVFCSNKGTYMTYSNARKIFLKICEKSDIKNIGIHSLRHSFATPMYDKRKNPCKIKVS